MDQFAISNMMKALNPKSARHAAALANPFWVTLFERLERVVKLQLAICPYSDVHRHESMVSGTSFEPLKRMYEQLSHGVSFDSTEQISQRQLNTALLAWLDGKAPLYGFDPERVTHGGLNEWKERFIISVSGGYPSEIVDSLRKFRDEVHVKVHQLFEEELRTNPKTDFGYWLERERKAGGRAILQSVQLYVQRMQEMASGTVPFSFDNVYSSQGLDQYRLIEEVLKSQRVAREEFTAQLRAFLDSDAFKDYPASHIASLVWASIGRAAALGQKEPPNAGMSNDIRVLTLLPYCNAVFVDNGCRALWEKIPRKYRPAYTENTRLFSYNSRGQFLAYLQEIEDNADAAVLASVREVYGEQRPFLTMYEERGE